MSDTLIKVEGISKKFCRDLKKSLKYGVKDVVGELMGKSLNSKLRKKEFLAVNDVSFELKRGECLGLIGNNGAGKSTLLKMLNGLIKPDAGKITMVGNVGALIELGAGFNPILTGRENIFINAAVLGIPKKRVLELYDEIVDFAEIEDFIDSPVQSYSSGMKVRLGFSIATTLIQPDILILDEVLAVGDAKFRNKCYNRIGELRKTSSVILVTHNMNYVGHICDKALVLNQGKIDHYGDVQTGVKRYMMDRKAKDNKFEDSFQVIEEPVTKAKFSFDRLNIKYGESINLKVELELQEDLPGASLRIPVYDPNSIVVAEWNSVLNDYKIDLKKGKNVLEYKIGPIFLKGSAYRFGIVLNDNSGIKLPVWNYKEFTLTVENHFGSSASYLIT